MGVFDLSHLGKFGALSALVIPHAVDLRQQEEADLLPLVAHEEVWRVREDLLVRLGGVSFLGIVDLLEICFDEAFG